MGNDHYQWHSAAIPFGVENDPQSTTPLQAAGLLTLAAVAKARQAWLWLVARGNKGIGKISSAHLICVAMFAAIVIGDSFAAGEVTFIMAIGAPCFVVLIAALLYDRKFE